MKNALIGFFIVTFLLLWFVMAFYLGYMVGKTDSLHLHYVMPAAPVNKLPSKPFAPKPMIPMRPMNKIEVEVNEPDSTEFMCLAKTIYFEAGNQSYNGKLAVGTVVMNRVSSSIYPDTICGVVYQKDQFSWYWDGKTDNVPTNAPGWEDSILAAEEIITGEAMVYDATVMYYHADYVHPYWADSMKRVAKIDNHIFYRL